LPDQSVNVLLFKGRNVTDIRAEIAELRTFSRKQLLQKWRELYDGAPAPNIRRELMIPFLAYKVQENAYGGLKPSTRAELRRIGRALETGSGSMTPDMRPRTKPGTRMVRHWRGKPYEVVVTELGFEYSGKSYGSLSQIAREITGTRWSGPAFFGLRKATIARGSSGE
jgi:Protein of unknown function (DUF2924)